MDSYLPQATERSPLRRLFLGLLLLPLLYACSPRTTTPQSRLWQGFVTRYNTLYNAHEAYTQSYQQLLDQAQDDYLRPLPLDPLVYSLSGKGERANFSRTLEKTRKAIAQHSMTRKPARKPGWRHDPKAVALQERTEYNPALADAWLLRAQSLFYAGELEEAYLTCEAIMQRYRTEPLVREQARLWGVRALTLLGRGEAAEELLSLFPEEASTAPLKKTYLYAATQAELLLQLGRDSLALPYLRTAALRAEDKKQRARLHFLLGQVLQRTHQAEQARWAFRRADQLASDPALELESRLHSWMLDGDTRRGEAELRRLAHTRRYREQQDRIFLALGKSLLANHQEPAARRALQQAIDSARQHRHPWAEAHLLLGDLALQGDRYPEACYHYLQAASQLHPAHPRQRQLQQQVPGLQALTLPAQEVRRGDSLLHLARLPEAQLQRYIDSLIRRKRQAASTAQPSSAASARSPITTSPEPGRSGFYFDDPQRIAEGRRRFLQIWGDRPLQDDWNRSDRAFAHLPGEAGTGANAPNDSLHSPSGASTDSLSPAFYLRQLPQTPQERAALQQKTATALLLQASILSERLQLLDHAQRSYLRLLRDFPDFPQREKALYEGLLLALRRGDSSLADSLRGRFLQLFPEAPQALALRQPNFRRALSDEAHRPARLLGQAWQAYQADDLPLAQGKLDSLRRLPSLPDELAPQTELLTALLRFRPGGEATLLADLRQLQQRHPQHALTTATDGLIQGLVEGRRLQRRPLQQLSRPLSEVSSTEPLPDSLRFLPAAAGEVPEVLLLTPRTGQQAQGVYFSLMTFVFSHFTQWTIEALPVEQFSSWIAFRLRGFRDPGAVQTFLKQAQADEGLTEQLPEGTRLLPLYPANLPLLQDATLPDYERFLRQADSSSPKLALPQE